MPRGKRTEPKLQARANEPGGTALADQLRAELPAQGLTEQKMFGGVGFMLNGNMIAGTFKDGLLLRVGKERYRESLTRAGARAMEMRGRPLEGYIRVDATELSEAGLRDWLILARAFVETLPPKARKQNRSRRKET